jgi:ABC-type transporter Mla subunit MlaD
MTMINQLKTIIAATACCAILSGCGRKPYQLAVRDGHGVEKGSHVFWDMGGTGNFKVVGDVTDVGVSEDSSPVLIKFELRKEFQSTIRENVSGTVLRNPKVAQNAFVLLMGGVGEDREPLLRGVTIQEAQTSIQQAFFDWLQTDLPEYMKKIKEDATQAIDQASEWANQKAGEIKEKAEKIKQDLSAPTDE